MKKFNFKIQELSKNNIILNARGVKFEILPEKFFSYSEDCRLGKLKQQILLENESDSLSELCDGFKINESIEIYFDKDADILKLVLDYLSSGELHINKNICEVYFLNELKYWMIDLDSISRCCFSAFKSNYEFSIKEIEYEDQIIAELCSDSEDEIDHKNVFSFGQKARIKLLDIFEKPFSSKLSYVSFIKVIFFF
jgi:hypothetical protein